MESPCQHHTVLSEEALHKIVSVVIASDARFPIEFPPGSAID